MILTGIEREMNHFHVCHGRGGGARGFNRAGARKSNLRVKGRCIGGVDADPRAVRDFGRIAGVPGTLLDLFDRQQYVAFHGHEPPEDWREACPDDFRRAANDQHPHVVFMSTPCKGFSGLLPEKSSKAPKYMALNGLTLRAVWLTLEAWKDDPVELIFFENVPRIASRGAWLIEQIEKLLRAYGYVVNHTPRVHDCGEIGNLAQHRARYLLVARFPAKVPAFMYEPPRRTVRGVGEVLERLPMPLSGLGGPMHRVPSLQWQTWLRLALVEAGSDWRSLNRLRVENGVLADYALMPTVTGVYRIVRFDEPSPVVTAANGGTGASVADPRTGYPDSSHRNKLAVGAWTEPASTVTGIPHVTGGAGCISDPRAFKDGRETYITGGHFGVVPWEAPAYTITGKGKHDNGWNSVADRRELPQPRENVVAVIRALDGTWHRPFTTLELAALQSLFDLDDYAEFELDGKSDSVWREGIGNAVPGDAAEAMGNVAAEVLAASWTGETFQLSATPIWVRPVAIALSVQSEQQA